MAERAEAAVEMPVAAGEGAVLTGASGMGGGVASTYIVTEREIKSSSIGLRIRSYTFDAASYAADQFGDKVVPEGTVMAASTYNSGMAMPRLGAATAIGVLGSRINARDGNVAIDLILAGALRQDRLWDNAGYGSIAASVRTDLPFVQFVPYDI